MTTAHVPESSGDDCIIERPDSPTVVGIWIESVGGARECTNAPGSEQVRLKQALCCLRSVRFLQSGAPEQMPHIGSHQRNGLLLWRKGHCGTLFCGTPEAEQATAQALGGSERAPSSSSRASLLSLQP